MKFKVFDKEKKKFVDFLEDFFISSSGVLHEYYKGDYHDPERLYEAKDDLIPIFSTDQKDIEGNEIYEGDVMLTPFYNGTDKRVVEFKNAYFYPFDEFNSKKCKIIGSIYTNPELMEKG